jgi:dihydroorotate dehydrogenase electron transfer subunit
MQDSSAQQLPAQRYLTVPLLRRDSIGSTYHVLTFDVPDGLDAQPGQFVMLREAAWGDAPLLPRPMSCLTGGTTPSILLRVVGKGTIRMARSEPGEQYCLLGPLGNPWRACSPGRRPLLVAGGVGVAPLLFLARVLTQQGKQPICIYGGRSARDLPLDDELGESCELLITTNDGSRGTRGVVTDVMQRVLEPTMEVYTCGPEPMLAKVAEVCTAHGVPCEVSLESPMACGFGVCLGCAVPTVDGGYVYGCTEGPCIDARRIDWRRVVEGYQRPPDAPRSQS